MVFRDLHNVGVKINTFVEFVGVRYVQLRRLLFDLLLKKVIFNFNVVWSLFINNSFTKVLHELNIKN